MSESNGNGATATKPKTILGIPCGCDNRRDILTAGDWKMDAIIVGSVTILVAAVILYKYKMIPQVNES